MSNTLNPYFYAYNPELLAFEHAWVDYVKNGNISQTVIRPEVADSWRRCRASELDPLSQKPVSILPDEALEGLIAQRARLLSAVTPFMKMLKDTALGSGFRILLTDEKGCVLKSIGDSESLVLMNKTNLFPGALLSEESAGTNGVALAIYSGRPISLAGAEHYLHSLHRISCSAAPILDESERIVGVLAVVGRFEVIHGHTLGMVAATADAVRNRMQITSINELLVENNVQLITLLNMLTDGVVYAKNGVITEINGEMEILLGRRRPEIVGSPTNAVIETTPPLHDLSPHRKYGEGEIMLKGAQGDTQCLLDIRIISDEKTGAETGRVMIFTRIEEIQMLARKIKFSARYRFENIIGQSAEIQEAVALAERAAKFDARVVVEGESGTGKEMLAQAIHNASARRHGPFVAVDCGTIPSDLLESQLFGYEPGAFTGASREGKKGLFELANKGTIFLDEIGNMPPDMQIKLLRVLQEDVFLRVGGTKPVRVDVRVIAATNIDLGEAIKNGVFRHDLFYRLNVFYIKMPPLRQRIADIPLLVEHMLSNNNVNTGVSIDKKALDALMDYDWPGNIRQLSNAIERAIIMQSAGVISVRDLPIEVVADGRKDLSIFFSGNKTLNDTMRDYVRFVLQLKEGNVSKAAATLGVSRTTVYKMLSAHDASNGEPRR